ncbi:helix-turn-helix domain-containing protein [Micromonospora fluostatini]
MTAFGEAMKRIREERELSMRAAAGLVPMAVSYWWRLEAGTAPDPSPKLARDMDEALGQGGRLFGLLGASSLRTPVGGKPVLLTAEGPEPLTSSDVAEVHATIGSLIGLDQQFGANELYPVGLRALRAFQSRIDTGRIEAGLASDARRAAAELAEVCGWLAYDADDQDLAGRMFRESRLTAEEIGDLPMEMFVRDLGAMQALHLGRWEDALHMANQAIGHPLVRGRMEAIFRLRQGRALAALGSEREALDALNRSRVALAGGMNSQDSPWTWWMHEAEFCLHLSLALSALGRHSGACEVSQRSMELLPKEQVRDWAVYQAYRISVLIAAGAWADSVAALGALQLRWPTVRSTRTANLVMAAATRRGVPVAVTEAARQCLGGAA